MTFEEIKALDEQYVMPAYSRFPVAVDHGKGATVWDVAGKEYIDFTAGIGVCSLGYEYQTWVDAVSAQACTTPSLTPSWPRSCAPVRVCPT